MNKRNKDKTDDTSQSGGSLWGSFKGIFCPCLLPTHRSPLRNNHLSFQPLQHPEQSQRGSGPYDDKTTSQVPTTVNKEKQSKSKKHLREQLELKRQSLLDKASSKKDRSQIFPRQATLNRRSLGGSARDYSVNSLTEKQLISVGVNDRHLLVKVASIHLAPNPSALKKELSLSRRQDQSGNSDIDRYWVQRYALFQRFDEGIKLDEKSWRLTPPGPVCEWVAGKCGEAKVIVDAFAAVGGTAIRLAAGGNCRKIIVNDWDERRLNCMLNNAKVYEVDKCVELSLNDFLRLEKPGVQVVFAQPPLGDLEASSHGSLSIVDFEPSLDKVIFKAMSLANNFLLLLPAATSIDVLCSCINKCATEIGKMKDSCSAKLQKIYWQGELRYILLSVGRLVQEEVKLSHELDYIYSRLQGSQKSAFKHKKIVKILREEYGMIFLFNLLKESQKKLKQKKNKFQEKPIDAFLQLIRQRCLISQEKLQKHLNQQDSTNKKRESHVTNALVNINDAPLQPMMEEEKVNQDLAYFRQSEQTQSQVSHYSYLSSLQKPLIISRQPRIFAQSFGSIIIKRTLNGSREKRSLSPQSPLGSPNTPTRKVRNKISPKNRTSQVVVARKPVQRNNTIQKNNSISDY